MICPICQKNTGKIDDQGVYYCRDCDFKFYKDLVLPPTPYYQELYKDWDVQGVSLRGLAWGHKQALRLIRPQMNLLDIGCAQGLFVKKAADKGAKAYGFDINPDLIKIGRDEYSLKTIFCACLENLNDFFGQKFDLITLIDVLEHLPNPKQYLEKVKNHLKESGIIFVSLPNRKSHPRFLPLEGDRPPHHLTWWSEKSLFKALDAAGYQVLQYKNQGIDPKDMAVWFDYWLGNKIKAFKKAKARVQKTALENKNLARPIYLTKKIELGLLTIAFYLPALILTFLGGKGSAQSVVAQKKEFTALCPVCGSQKMRLKDSFFVCENCKYETARFFDHPCLEDYYNGDKTYSVQTTLDNISPQKLRKYHQIALKYLDSLEKTSLSVCDIGCGPGIFLSKLKEKGFQAFGYDIVKEHVKTARDKYKLVNVWPTKTLKEYCQKVGVKQGFFDVITMFELIEHAPDINSLLEQTVDFLKPGGLVIISTPNSQRLKIKEVWDYPPIHLSRLNSSNLKQLLAKFGLPIQWLKTYNELGYYSSNLIHKIRFCRQTVESIVAGKNSQDLDDFAKAKLTVLKTMKLCLCKVIDFPLFLALIILRRQGHTIIAVAKKI